MTDQPRKATEVLLELEAKIDNLISLIKAQGFANQILSNKINELMQSVQQQAATPKYTAEAVQTSAVPGVPLSSFKPADPERQVPIFSERRLPETNHPDGFRRTSRPETYAGDDVYLGDQQAPVQFPMQMPKGPPPGRGSDAEVIIPQQEPAQKQARQQAQPPKQQQQPAKQPIVQNAIPVVQRIVNKDGKSVFLADVEITDLASSQSVYKGRTNGTGKWMASLGVGAYRVVIRKKESAQQARMEAIQDVQVDGSRSPLELQTLIIK